MTLDDPIEPFRREFEASYEALRPYLIVENEELKPNLPAIGSANILKFKRLMEVNSKAHTALQIAETEGADAALLWKLSQS